MRVLPALACFLVSTTAWAGQQCHTATIPLTTTNWTATVQLPRFDPALGTLNQVTVTLVGSMTGSVGIESLDSNPSVVTSHIQVQTTVSRPNNTILVSVLPTAIFTDNLTAYDGTIDFAGTSGVTHANITAQTTGMNFVSTAGDLALFSGPAGNPGTINLPVSGAGTSVIVGGPQVSQISTQAGAAVTVCYNFTGPAVSFCLGDGSATACPCGNASAVGAGEGCASSTGVGARLAASGTASVSSDTLVLACSGLPATTTALFFQGTLALNNGNGVVFGDGLRCIGGTVHRLRIKMATAGVATYPESGDAPVSVVGSVPANSVRHYQVWYRNAAPFCTAATFNLSQGLTLSWLP